MGGDVATWYVSPLRLAFEARGGMGGDVAQDLEHPLRFEAREGGGGGEQDHNLINYVNNCFLK